MASQVQIGGFAGSFFRRLAQSSGGRFLEVARGVYCLDYAHLINDIISPQVEKFTTAKEVLDKAKGSMNERIQAALKQMATDKEASTSKDVTKEKGTWWERDGGYL